MEILLVDINQEQVLDPRVDNCAKVHANEAQQLVNTFLDDIITNTYAFIHLKPYLPQWRNKYELFDLGIINQETHHQVIQKLKQRQLSMYLLQEQKWEAKIKKYKGQLVQIQRLEKHAFELIFEEILCRIPPRDYPILLHDQWTTLILRKLVASKPCEVKQPQGFMDLFLSIDMKDHNLLSELYLFNFLLQDNSRQNPQLLCWGCPTKWIDISYPRFD